MVTSPRVCTDVSSKLLREDSISGSTPPEDYMLTPQGFSPPLARATPGITGRDRPSGVRPNTGSKPLDHEYTINIHLTIATLIRIGILQIRTWFAGYLVVSILIITMGDSQRGVTGDIREVMTVHR